MKPNRVEALTDGIFAIVMTLLILEVAVPQVHGTHINEQLAEGLIRLWPKVFSFIASFLILGIYWGGHHVIFQHVKRLTFHYMWLNILFLLTVSLIPFSTALIGEYPFQSTAQVVYGINLIVSGMLLYSTWRWAMKLGLIEHETISTEMQRNARNKILLPPTVYLIGIILGHWYPVAGVVAFILGPALYFVPVDSRVWRLITRSSRTASA